MSRYIIYTYQFEPITSIQKTLFPATNILPIKDRMEQKQNIFETFFDETKNPWYRGKKDKYESQTLHHEDHFIVFRLANNTYQRIEESFHISKLPHHPSCIVIIDNRQDIQHIAIEENSNAFRDTNVVAQILYYTYNDFLRKYGLHITINRDFQESEFWYLVKQYPHITMVRFQFSYPNLPRTLSSVNKLLATSSAAANSKTTKFEFNSAPSEHLTLDPTNDFLKTLAKTAADSGQEIIIKAKGIRHQIHTGTTFKSIEIDDINVLIQDNLLEHPTVKLATKFNSIK